MADVITLDKEKRPPPPADLPPSYTELQRMISQWRIARAFQEAEWAKNELARLNGRDDECPLKYMEAMYGCETYISIAKPSTLGDMRELLRVVLEILTYRVKDPNGTFGEGPVFEILNNCVSVLDWEDAYELKGAIK